jgi:hypothetical protein
LLEAACRQQLRALDLVWMTTAEGDISFPAIEVQPSASLQNPAPSSPPVAANTALEDRGVGKHPSRYRKLGLVASAAGI